MDRFELPWLGRRRGWLVLTQLALAGALFWMAATPPSAALARVRAARRRWWPSSRRRRTSSSTPTAPTCCRRPSAASGSSLNVLGYRLAMILSGGIALIWVDARQGGGWTWPEVYRLMAWLMVGAAVLSALLLPRLRRRREPSSVGAQRRARLPRGRRRRRRSASSSRDTRSRRWSRVAARAACSLARARRWRRQRRWADLRRPASLGIAFTLPLAAWAARAARFETLLGGLRSYFTQTGARRLPRLHRALQARRRLRRLADDAVPAPGDGLQHGRGRRGQQGDRPVADDRRRAARRRADAPARPVARADAVRRAADGQQPRLLVAGGERPRRCCPGSSSRPSTGASSSWPSRRRSTAGC